MTATASTEPPRFSRFTSSMQGISTDIALVELFDEPGLGDAYDFDAAHETVDLCPEDAR